jgi:succinate-semialdehyde dehydrogenase / glutarate-semialdehyde dehydrogenase
MFDDASKRPHYPALQLYVDGEWIDAGSRSTHTVLNPATGAPLGALPLASTSDLDRALEAADRSFKRWRHSTPQERASVLNKAAEIIRSRIEIIATVATQEQGKPRSEARIEATKTAELFEFYAGECFRLYGRTLVRPTGQRAMVLKEPVGPVVAFAPWNFPILNTGRKLGAPIATGCSVILKPAEETPGSAIEIMRALVEAGLPNGVAQLVFGVPDEVSRHLLASPIIRKISFTGSTAVGKHLLKLAAETVKRTTMELGGHAPVIMFDDADLDRALGALVSAKFRNAGQVCIAPTRFYVQEGVYDRFVQGFAERAGDVKVGDGLLEDTSMGAMANCRRRDAMETLVADALERGGTIRLGGERHGAVGYFWRPTLLTDVPTSARIMNEEPFGPVATVTPFRTFDEVVEQANRLPFGLAAYAFTENGRRANLISDALECGMVGINTTAVSSADAPFQGVKQSGHGSEEASEGLDACLVVKAVHHA